MNLYYFAWKMESGAVGGDIVATHPLIYQVENALEGCVFTVLGWQELSHEEAVSLSEADAIDEELFSRYLTAYGEGHVLCGECSTISEKVTGKEIYPHRRDLIHLKYFWCPRCGAYCGTHRETEEALGSPAGPDTREARKAAHRALDRIWKEGPLTRKGAYQWLRGAMGMTVEECHIGKMSEEQALSVEEMAKTYFKKLIGDELKDSEPDPEDEIPF